MTQLQVVKSEIERRIGILEKHKDTHETAAACRQELIWMKSFIESLEKEQDVDLEKEIVGMVAKQPFFIKAKDQIAFARHFYNLGLNAEANGPKIKGWVARGCDGLTIYAFRPEKGEDDYYVGKWIGDIDDSFAPEMTREDEPIEVELIINKV